MENLYVLTLGCQMNEYDAKRIAELLAATHGLKRVDTPEEADVLLVVTCSIREKAEDKVYSVLGTWRKLKEKRPILIGVGGCVASQEGEAIIRRAPFVDFVFGPQTIHRLPNLINECTKTRSPQVDISFPEIEKFDSLPIPKANGPTAFVSIMEGCSKYCTYCVVPYTRGEEVNRPLDDVLTEVAALAEQGVKEVTLLGQNVNAYRGPMHDGSLCDLGLLIHFVAEIPGIERIRFTTSHPVEFSDSLIQAYADVPKLVNHLHLPVQSGSDRILKLMKRGHTRADFIQKIDALRQVRPDISISSDFIVGFPSETERDFLDTLELVEHIGFDQSFSFIFSARPGTPAASIPDLTPMEEKRTRLARLQATLSGNARRVSEQMVGSTQTVLVNGMSKKASDEMSGRTENNRVVNFRGNTRLKGLVIPVRITQALPNSLRGEVI